MPCFHFAIPHSPLVKPSVHPLNFDSRSLSYWRWYFKGRYSLCHHQLNLFSGRWHQQGPVGRAWAPTSLCGSTGASGAVMPLDTYAALNTTTQWTLCLSLLNHFLQASNRFCKDVDAHMRNHFALRILCFWIWNFVSNAHFQSISEHQFRRKVLFQIKRAICIKRKSYLQICDSL